MNISQRQHILDLIDKIKAFDLIGFLRAQGVENLESHNYGDIKLSEFNTLLERMLEQLKGEVGSSSYRFLPNQYSSQTEFGLIDLIEDLNNLLTNIKVYGNEMYVIQTLNKLIFYQINYAFWDRSIVRVHDPRAVDIRRRLQEARLLEETLKIQSENLNAQKVEAQNTLTDVNRALNELRENTATIASSKIESTNALSEIKRNVEDSNAVKQQIDHLHIKTTELLNKISVDINENSSTFNEIVNRNSTLEKELRKTIEDSNEKNEEIKMSHEYINSQKDQIEKMVGLATDGAIGYKFDERQKNIFKSLKFWKYVVPISYGLAAIWVGIVFSLFAAKFSNEWLNLTINVFKTTPAWLLVAFCTNQYKKEREFEEEYAFKSAVAMTITSYTSLLSNDEIDKMKTKDQVLSKVLDDLYSSPLKKDEKTRRRIFNTKNIESDLSSKAKDLEVVIKPMIELVKEIKK